MDSNKQHLIFKTAFITFWCTLVFGFLLMYGGCRGISNYMASQRNCEFLNIDNYEVRTHSNIPKTKGFDCKYDKAALTKSTVFILDLTEDKLSNYIGYSELHPYTDCTPTPFAQNTEWNDSISQIPREHLYYKTGHSRKDNWVYVLDSANQTLWAELTAKE